MLERLKRLPEMGAPEIGWRLREKVLIGLDRVGLGAAGPAGEEVGESFLRGLRFYLPAGAAGRADLVALWHRRFGDRAEALAAEAERLCAHRFELLGFGEVDCGPEIDWHRDPVTGGVWERRFWADYDLVHDHPAGDPKVVHELNRHQHLPRLAKAYYLLGEERWAREVIDQLLGWIDQNPPGRGVHWHSSLEIALRVTSWLWATAFVLDAPSLGEAEARRIGTSLFAQLEHVHRYPSLYSSPNTHLIGEAAALFLGGLAFAGCERGRAWLLRGAELLAAEAERQVGRDGVHAELSPWYHCYALDSYLQVMALARGSGWDLGPEIARRVEAMLDFLLQVVRPDGTLPLLGDDDGGRALALGRTHYGDPRDLLATGAALFGRGDLEAAAGGLCEETLWLLGARGVAAWEALAAEPSRELRASFPEAGYFVQRSGRGPGDAHLVFDCGGLGRLGGGHGHADALSLTLFAGGEELLVDPGTFVYNGAPAWRDHFRSTAAHSTATVDGAGQSEPEDTFRWRRQAAARLLDDARLGAVDYVAGEHDGYAAAGVVHRRRVVFVRPGYWLVLDDFRGAEANGGGGGDREHDFEIVYQLAPGCEPSPVDAVAGGTAASLTAMAPGGAGLLLALQASAPLEVATVAGAGDPPRGWVSRRYGERRPAPAVVARFRARTPASALSVLVPFGGGGEPAWAPRPLAVEAAPGSAALAVAVGRSGGEDLAILSPGGGEVAAGPCRGRGEVFWVRLEREGAGGRAPGGLAAVGARELAIDGVALFASSDPITYHHESGWEA